MTVLLTARVSAWVADHPASTVEEIARGVHTRTASVREVLRSGFFVSVPRASTAADKAQLWSLRVDASDQQGRAGTHPSQCARILAVLRDGRAHTAADLHRRCGFSRLNSRIAELRPRVAREGLAIECRHNGDPRGGSHAYEYVLVSADRKAA